MQSMLKRKSVINFLKYRYLLSQLVKRDFKVKYKRSVLGIVWSLLNPLMNMVILTLVFSTLFKSNIPNFPVYFLCGNVMFSFFSESTSQALGSVFLNASLIKKVYIPKYMFPLSKNVFSLVNLLISFIAVILVMIVTGVSFHITTLFIFIPMAYLFVFTVGISLILSSIAVFFRDLAHLYIVLITALNFLTPIFYPVDILPGGLRSLVELSPLTQAIQMLRELILYNELPNLNQHLSLFGISVGAMIIGVVVFNKKQDDFILYI